ncbi:hypothetical protein EJB05_25839, partial [Eragrostis curvula]
MEDVLITFLDSAEGGHEHFDHESLIERLKKNMAGAYNMVVSGPSNHRENAIMIDDINERLNNVIERRGRYTVDGIVANSATMSSVNPLLDAKYKEVTQLVGIDNQSSKLISMLSLQEDGEPKTKTMKIVSLVGPGGLGKTTLAKAMYDKLNRIKFRCTAFVPVGRDRELKEVFLNILMDLDKEYTGLKYRAFNQMQLINELREFLGSKRYLIVLDDIRKTKSWDELKLALAENNSESIIITTTRNSAVAEQADEIYKLQPLPYKKSRKLFYTRIFGGEGKCPDNQLDKLSDKILKKCNGVPLAIITMASLLVGKSREQWTEVCNSVAFHDKVNNHVTDTEWILSLSYYDLPAHLKTCLLYLSAFPEYDIIDKDSLIWKWIAEDFVHNKPGTGYFEVGEEYFNELINRRMIEPVESKYLCGFIVGCRVHDMVLDLLRIKLQQENFVTIFYNDEGTSLQRRVRRLVYQNSVMEATFYHDRHINQLHLRSLIACTCDHKGLSLLGFELLRVLALEGCSREGFIHLEHLESLIHLRYLGLRSTHINELPKRIGALKSLQTLDINDTSIKELPSSIGQATQLICLCAGMAKVPNGVIEKLTFMEELEISVHEDTVGKFVRELGNLRELRVLKAELDVTEKNMQSDFVQSLLNLHKIQNLDLSGHIKDIDQALCDTLVLPQTLQYLILLAIRFPSLPSSLINPSRLPKLSHLDLSCGSVSFTVGNEQHDVLAVDTETRKDAPAVMPNLERLEFQVHVDNLMHANGSSDNLGLEYLPLFQKVRVEFRCEYAFSDDVEKDEAALRKEVEVLHPNRPMLVMEMYGKNEMKRYVPAQCSHRLVVTVNDDLATEVQEDVNKSRGGSVAATQALAIEAIEMIKSMHPPKMYTSFNSAPALWETDGKKSLYHFAFTKYNGS